MTKQHEFAAADLGMELLLERKRLLDDVWFMALFALFAAVGAPWYLRALDIDFAPVAWSLFAYGSFYALVALSAGQLSKRRAILLAIDATQVSGVLFLGWIWHLTGSMQNPMFLLAFLVPVVAGSLVPVNWQAYGTTLLVLATVLLVAIMDTPELRWFVAQFGLAISQFVAALPQKTGASMQPFPTLSSPPAYHFVLLVMFAALLFTVALMTESLTSFLNRITNRLESTMRAREGTEDLYSEVLRVAPLPTALVYSDTLRVARASESFLRHFFLKAGSLLDADLFSIVEFTHPEVVQALVAGTGGEIPVAVYRVEGEPRAARVRVDPVTYDSRRYVYVTIQDMTDLQTLLTAFNAVDQAMMVLNQNQRLLYCNHAAEQMWGELSLGADVSSQLRKANLPDGWWQLGMRSRQERRLELNGRKLVAQCVTAKIPGERDALTVLSICSAGGES